MLLRGIQEFFLLHLRKKYKWLFPSKEHPPKVNKGETPFIYFHPNIGPQALTWTTILVWNP